MYKDLLNCLSVQKKKLWRYSCNNAPILKLCQLHIKYNDSHVQNKTAQNDWFKMHSVICDLLYFERQNLSSGCTGYDCLYFLFQNPTAGVTKLQTSHELSIPFCSDPNTQM